MTIEALLSPPGNAGKHERDGGRRVTVGLLTVGGNTAPGPRPTGTTKEPPLR